MSVNINGEKLTTFSDYMNDETKVNKAEKALVELEAAEINEDIFGSFDSVAEMMKALDE